MASSKIAVLLAVGLLALMHGASSDTTGLRWWGYTFVSDVQGYVNITQDYCAIKNAVAAGDLADALSVYTNGRNSYSGANLRRYMSWSLAQHPGEPTYDTLLAYHGNASWLDTAVKTAFAEGQGAKAAALIGFTTVFKYFFHELDAAYTRTMANNTALATGSPHNLDEAWSLYAGGHPEQCDSFHDLADRLADAFGTSYAGQSPINMVITLQMNDLLAAAITGPVAGAMYNESRTAIRVQSTVLLAQAVLHEAYSAHLYAKCKNATLESEAKQTLHAFWVALAPELIYWGASADAVVAAEALVTTEGSVSYTKVSCAIKEIVSDLGVDAAVLGTPIFDKINKASSCTAAHAPKLV